MKHESSSNIHATVPPTEAEIQAEEEIAKGYQKLREAADYHDGRMKKRVRRLTGEPAPIDFEEPITGVFAVPPEPAFAKR